MVVALALVISVSAWAVDTHCDVCGMSIPDHARNHLVLKAADPAAKELHVCSVPCARKARKHDQSLSRIDIADFNHPESFLSGERAFVLIQSRKVKADLGELTMPPYVVGFGTKKEAEAAQAKYGDGTVVEGIEGALK